MITLFKIVILCLICCLSLSISSVGLNPVRPLQLNKGQSTKYMFYILPEQQVLTSASIRITFPDEFNFTVIASTLSCMASSVSYSWITVPCTYSLKSVTVYLETVKDEQTNILISQPTNPYNYSMSSYFSVCLLYNTQIAACNQQFGKVIFPDPPVVTATTTQFPIISSLNSLVVGQSSTYQIQFSVSKAYSIGNTVRITFPLGFQTSSNPICQMNGTYNQVITTFVWPDQRTVECQNINKTIYLNQSIKIIGIFNPNFAGNFGNTASGFIIEILQETTTIIQERLIPQMAISIAAGTLTGSISQANNFIVSDSIYTVYLNLLNSLTSANFITIEFPNSWILYNGQCSVISGITLPPKGKLVCTNSTVGLLTVLKISGFLSASVSNQLVFNIMVRSPATPGTYTVNIKSGNAKGTVDSMVTSIYLNSTYGDYSMLSINAITAKSDVQVSGTGPLQLTFFLNYALPQTNVLTQGKFLLKIYPQIPLPPPLINGVLKCYFFNNIPAQTCTWDTSTSASYTLVTITTPLTSAFQYSQIPITITTEGAVNTSKIGITIADIVTRYRFQLQAYQQNNSVIPTEVYFSQFIAAPIPFSVTSYALTKQVNEYTHLRFQFSSPYNFTTPYVDNIAIKIQFYNGGGWASNLGLQPNTIYKRYPCVFSDNKLLTNPPQYNSKVACDLYTYLTGPHASLTNSTFRGPYILVYGFTNQMWIGNQVRLELGNFLIGSSTNLLTYVRFSLVQETPTALTKYVELYYKQIQLFTTTSQNAPTASVNAVTDALNNATINAVDSQSIAFSTSSNAFAIIYQYDQLSTPSFPNSFFTCTKITATQVNWCVMLGYPVNYIVEYSYTGTFSATVNSKINITNGVYSGTFTATARAFSSSSLTLFKSTFNVVYNPIAIVTSYFSRDQTYWLYKGLEDYYSVSFTAVTSTPNNGFIRLIFSNGVQLGQNPYCTSSDFTYMINELGLVCIIQSSTTLKISNIAGLVAGNSYAIRVRLSTLLTTGGTVQPAVTIQTHYSIKADPSIVNSATKSLNQSQTNRYSIPNSFVINNPRTTFETPTVGYIGKFQIVFSPSSDTLSAYQIKLILNNHNWNGGFWSTPNQVTTDPLVCQLNYIRVACTYTLSPLTVIMNVSPAGMTLSSNNIIILDTEYLVPYNGILHPTQGGEYNTYVQFLDDSSNIIQKQSFYHQVLPNKLRNFYVNSTVNDIGVENMFYVQFEVDSTTVNANNHATLYSRIYIEFPTVDSRGNPLFANNLGGYTKTGELVGCFFDTWSTYYVTSATGRLQCRLIMSQVPGDPVRVEIINHNPFSGNNKYMRLWIAKVFNPTVAVTSVPISIRIDHVQVSNNNVFRLFYDTFDVFMNSQVAAPVGNSNRDCNANYSQAFSDQINNVNWFRFYPTNLGEVGINTNGNSNVGYYYVLDTTSDWKPISRESMAPSYCNSGWYYMCMSFVDINYLVIWSYTNNQQVRMYMQFPGAISQVTTYLVAKVWQNQRYMGTHTINMVPACWNQMIGNINSLSYDTTGGSRDYALNRKRVQFYFSFYTNNPIPAGGTIQFVFPTNVPQVYPHCRSQTNIGSDLVAQGTVENGQVGCLVQNTRTWVITGFNALPANSWIKVIGQIDLPATSGYFGSGQIITYNNTHSTNIRTNGFIIDYYSNSNFGVNLNNYNSQNIDSEVVLQQTLPLRVGYVGPLRIKITSPATIVGPNTGKITIRLPGVSTLSQAGGFTYVSSKKHVCQIIQVSNREQTGCIVNQITTDSNASFPNYMFTIVTTGNLASATSYYLIITTHTGSQPEGLTFPTAVGTYKVDVNIDATGSSNFLYHNHLYLETYGTKFSLLQVTAMVTCPSHRNLIWFKITPTTTITTTQQLVIEVPTISASGVNLFNNDLGYGTADGSFVNVDILGGSFSQGFMQCKLFSGSRTYYKNAKIICGNFISSISSSQTLFFALQLINPSLVGSQISIPFYIYSVEQGTTLKTNFDVVQKAVHLRSDVYTKTDVIGAYSQNQQLQTSGVYLDMISRNYWNAGAGEYYLIFFNFPLRNNGKITNGCSYPGSSIYGDAYYHQNLWVIVCTISSATLDVPGGGYDTRNLRIAGFYTPFYYLSAAQQAIVTYTYYFSSKLTTVGYISDGYPNQSPKVPSGPSFSLTSLHQTTKYGGSRDDYTISFTYSSSATVDVSFTQQIAVIFPTSTIDYTFPATDCLEAPGSQIQIASCYINASTGVVWITPVVKNTYTSNLQVSVITRNLAIRNPVNNYSSNTNLFVIKYYSWQNISKPALNPIANNNYCFLIINNLGSNAISYTYNPNPYSITTFPFIQYQHSRYYSETPFSSLIHRAPFQMEFQPAIGFPSVAGSNYHTIKLVYPSTFGDASMFKIKDLQVFRPICYLNNQRIRKCVIDTTNKFMTMSFQMELTANAKYHLKFSILDSRNADIDGFLATTAISNLVLMYQLSGSSTWYYTETDQFPTLSTLPTGASSGPFRGIVAGTPTYVHTVASQLNFVNLLLTFNRTDITGLVFQIPSFDNNGNPLFSSAAAMSTTFMSQQNGGSYPCSNNGYSAGGNAKCFILNGDSSNPGFPTRIVMTDFTYVTKMNCRLVFINPPNVNVFFTVNVKAFGGTKNANNLYGNIYMGHWQFNQIFQITNSPSLYTNTYTSTSYRLPSQSPWRNNTNHYVFSQNWIMGGSRSSIAAIKIYDSSSSFTDKSFCQATLGSNNFYDDLAQYTLVSGGVTQKYAYFMTTWQSNTNISYTANAGWTLSYLKCKYYASWTITAYYGFSDYQLEVATNQYNAADSNSLSSTGITAPTIKYFSQNYYGTDGTDTTFVTQVDLTPTLASLAYFSFRNGDAMVLAISYSLVFWGTMLSCSVLGGINSTSPLLKSTCNVGSNSLLYITNIGGFITDPLLASTQNYRVKVSFLGSGLSSLVLTGMTSQITLYSNIDAYSNGYQGIFSFSVTLPSSCYYTDPSNCYHAYPKNGTFSLQSLSDTFIRVIFTPQTLIDFAWNNGYQHYFYITFTGFSFGSCNIGSVVAEMSYSPTPGSGVNNTVIPSQALCSSKFIKIGFINNYWAYIWGNTGPASDNQWATNQYLIMYITINSIVGKDLPVLHHQYAYAAGSYNYRQGSTGSYYSGVLGADSLASQPLASSASISTISNNRGGVSELIMQITALATDVGPTNTGYYILAQFVGTSGWTSTSDPFSTYTNTNNLDEKIACKCVTGTSPLTTSVTSPYVDTTCRRRLPSGSFNNYAILIGVDADQNQDLICFFPEFTISTNMNFYVQFKLVYGDSYPPQLSTLATKYSSLYRVSTSSLSFSGSTPVMPNSNFNTITETPPFYSTSMQVGSSFSGTYTLNGTWSSGLNSPYIYINFLSAGPIPANSFCLDSNSYLQCRVYTGLINVVVAQLKSSSSTSFTMSRGAQNIAYPSAQYSDATKYGVYIYVGVGTWSFYTTISRSQNNLYPISTNTFLVYTDKYGSARYNYQTNALFSLNTNGQYLYNYILTGSKIEITWSGLTTKSNCQVWVQNEPQVTLTCIPTTGLLTIYSMYYDYTTTNNIFVSLGVLNPSTPSTTITMKLYSYYYSSTRYLLTISTTASYSSDVTYLSNTQISKANVLMYPFSSRISNVANSPLRIRLTLSGTMSTSNGGRFLINYSQLSYSTNYLCYFIVYSSYTAMMQKTQRKVYKASSYSVSGSSLTIYPPSFMDPTTSTYYELVIMPLDISGAGCSAQGCATQSGFQQLNFDLINLIAYSTSNSNSPFNQQVNKLYSYEGTNAIGLQQIYFLTVQPITTSIYLSMNLNFTSSHVFPNHYLEIVFYDLQQTAFTGYSTGSIIPCQLSSNFVSIGGRQGPQCRVASADSLNNYVKIRIQNIGFISVGTYWVSIDDILLPTPSSSDNNNKFDISIIYFGPSNLKYENFFPEILQIDNTNSTAVVTSSNFSFANPAVSLYGAPVTGQFSFTWPFDTSSSGSQSKIAINFNGGFAATWSSINSVTFVDTYGTYQLLWVNTQLNKFVFSIPNKGNGIATTTNITSLNNPYPYQRQVYNANNNIVINFYNNFFLHTKSTFNQPLFTYYTQNPPLIYINQNYPCNTFDNYPLTNTFGSGALTVLLLSVQFSETVANIQARNLGILQIQFTSGMSFLQQCRVLRNNTQYVNPTSTCHNVFDGTYWNIYIYDVTNSQLSTGWWIQVFATYSSASLSYTSYIRSTANNVIEYQQTYPISIGAYNSSRLLPTVLTFTNNKYTKYFFEIQYRFLQAVTSQSTQYLKFRLTSPMTNSGSSDKIQIWLPDNTAGRPFTPKTSGNNMICQFLPAMSADQDFTVGIFGQGTLYSSSGRYYIQCNMYNGGITAGSDYLLQISEYNTATSSFNMAPSPRREKIDILFYNNYHGWSYWDSFWVKSYCFFRSAQFLHTTTTVNDYETLTINYTPYGSLSSFTTTSEISLRLSVETRYHLADGGVTSIFTSDSRTLVSGNQYSGVVSNPNNNQINTIQFGQYAYNKAPLRFVLAKQNSYVDNTAYTWIIPLIQNPSAAYVTLRYNLTLVCSPSSSWEYIFNHYQSINEYYTVADTSSVYSTSITNSVRNVQTVSNIDLSVNLGNYSISQWNTAIFKINNALNGLIPSISSPNDTTNYNYYYFSNINMIMAQKKTVNTINNIGIGSSSSSINYQSTFGLSFVKIFSNSNAPMATNPYTIYNSNPASLTLNYLTTYSSSAITLSEGYEVQGSTAMYQVTFTTPIIPEGGQIRILFLNFTSNNNGSCRVGTNFVKSSAPGSVLRCYRTSQGFRITGFAQIAAGTSVTAYIFLKSQLPSLGSSISIDIFGIWQNNSTRIALSTIRLVTHTSGTQPSFLSRFQEMVVPIFASVHYNNYYMIEGSFNLRIANLYNGDYLYFYDPSWSTYGDRRMLIKQNSTAVTGWTELSGYAYSNYYRFKMPTNYVNTLTLTTNTQFIFRYTCYFSDPYYNGFAIGLGNQKFWLQFYSNNLGYNTEQTYYDFTALPIPYVLTINNRYKAAGKQTVLDLQFTVDVNLAAGTQIVVSFDTYNLLNQMFANELQNNPILGQTYRYLDCREWTGYSVISNSRIICMLYYGNNAANPPTPAQLVIKTTNAINGWSSTKTVRFMIANVMNPTTAGLNTGITVNMNSFCQNQLNQSCSFVTAKGYYVTTTSTENPLNTTTTFSSSSSLVLTTGLTHTFTLTLTTSITTTDAIYIIYPQNFEGLMPSDCSVINYTCYVFPTRRWVVLYPTTLISGFITLAITSMNNPYYAQPYSLYFQVTVARENAIGDTYKILQGPFTPVTYSFQSSINATSMTVSPTQTPNMYLRNYANTVKFVINNLFSDARAKAIYIQAPADVTSWDPTYCNASITTTSNFNYPLRFICTVDPLTPMFLRITLDKYDFSTYDPAWGLMSILVHAKFTLADFSTPPTLYLTSAVPSGAFYAYSSVNASSSSSLYYMSKTSVTISISQNQVPIISTINFNQQSFADRSAKVGNKEVFYLLFKPIVNVVIGSIVFTIPSQFNYPGVFQFDNCQMIGRQIQMEPNCQQSRSQGQTLVTLVPTNYDNNVKIIQIGTVSQANWFTAPSLPGDFYEMNVAIYSVSGALIAKQTRKISPVYGQNFDITQMSIQNIQDTGLVKSVYDLTFKTGNLQIPPGAPTTATTQTSEIQFIFQNYNSANPTNVFTNNLKTGLFSGDEVGCKIWSGITALPGLRLKCILYVGSNNTDKPKIRVINYNFINPNTTIVIGFAGIQSLPSSLVNTISVGVVIYYNDIGSSTYLYIPTPIITVPTNATSLLSSMDSGWQSGWIVNGSFSGTNIVLQPTIFTVGYVVPYWYWWNSNGSYWMYNYAYSSTGANDQYILLTFYPPTVLDKNNPTSVTCSSCTGVDVYYASGMVRFRHSTSTSGNNYRTFTFNGFPTSAYKMLNQTITITFEIYSSYQAILRRNFTVSARSVQKCTLFNFGVVSVSSLNGGQIGVTYLFSIKTNHFVPGNGALSITLPIQYGDMIDNGANCYLIGFQNTNAYCVINTPSRIDIYMNGTEISTTSTYSVKITGLQNPNIDSSNFIFIATSYYISNIYLGLKICQNQITPPAINIKALRTCTLSWNPLYYNQNYNASYTFQLSCSDVFRGDSTLYISLPSAFAAGNPLGSYPCSSYESTTLVNPICTLSNIGGVLTLSTNIDASSQSSLSLLIKLVNPINNTYSANAYVTSKGTQYASSGNSSLTILSNTYVVGAKLTSVYLMNSPKEAGLLSTYIFKISPISTFNPSNLGITFPDNFFIDANQLTIGLTTTSLSNFFDILNYNNIQVLINNASAVGGVTLKSYPTFSVSKNSIIYLTNISSSLNSSQWTYILIRGIKNPSTFISANFTVAYYLISNGFQALQWLYENPLTYYISSPPAYISIQSVSVSDFDLLYPATYSFTFGSDLSNIAISGKNLSYIVVIPTFYKSVLWANSPPTCKFSQLNRTSSCYSYQGQIIVTETFTTNYKNLTLTISTLLNPALATTCKTTDTNLLAQTFFIIRIIDTISNAFLFESSSVVDGSNCLSFRAIRIPISLEYPIVMSAGLAYNITFGLSKPSSNLKITAYITNSGFSFSPAIVQFDNFYDLTKNTQLFLRSDVAPGDYVISFNKSESSITTNYRNILPISISVTAATTTTNSASSPTISVRMMSDSTIGYPVVIPIDFSLPSSTRMTLFMSIAQQSNQTLAQYSSFLSNFTIGPRIITIQSQQTNYNFTLSQGRQIVPPPITLNLKLSSNYPIVHQLKTPTVYICFDRDPKYNSLYPPLRVTVTQFLSSCNLLDVGKTVTNILISNSSDQSSATQVSPKIISISLSSAASTGANFVINSLSSGTIYYLCMPAGYQTITNSSLIATPNTTVGISGSSVSVAQTIQSGSTAQINYRANVSLTNLSQQSNYVLYAVSKSNLGTSEIKFLTFSTVTLSKGVQMHITFTSVIQNYDLVEALVQVLRISPLRIKILTSIYDLQTISAATTINDNSPKFPYDVVIAPDATNDIISPLSIVSNFANSTALQSTFKSSIPTFDNNTPITYFQLRPAYPIIAEMPKAISINLYNATFQMKFWNQSNVYILRIQGTGRANKSLSNSESMINPIFVGKLNASQKAKAPSSNQIKLGQNAKNQKLGKYESMQVITNQNGVAKIVMTDLKPNSVYDVYITAGPVISYEPIMLWKDQNVIKYTFNTLPNPNIGNSATQAAYVGELSKYNKDLSDAISNFMKSTSSAMKD